MYDPLSEKFLTRLRLKFSHLKEHKFRHGFADSFMSCVNYVIKKKYSVTS